MLTSHHFSKEFIIPIHPFTQKVPVLLCSSRLLLYKSCSTPPHLQPPPHVVSFLFLVLQFIVNNVCVRSTTPPPLRRSINHNQHPYTAGNVFRSFSRALPRAHHPLLCVRCQHRKIRQHPFAGGSDIQRQRHILVGRVPEQAKVVLEEVLQRPHLVHSQLGEHGVAQVLRRLALARVLPLGRDDARE